MTKKELVDQIAGSVGLTKKDTQNIVDAVLDTISDALEDGEKVMLVGFGSFDVANRKAREGRNPQTGEKMHIPAKRVPRFRPGSSLREKIK